MSNLTHCTIVPVTVHDGTIVHVAREDTSGIIYVPTSEIATKIIHKELATLAKWLNRNSIHSLEATPNLLYQLKHLHVIHPNTNRVYFVSQDDLRIILRSYAKFSDIQCQAMIFALSGRETTIQVCTSLSSLFNSTYYQ